LNADIGNPGGNSGGWLAHIGGAAFGFLSIRSLQKGNDVLLKIQRFFIGFRTNFKRKPKLKVKYKKEGFGTPNRRRPATDEDFNASKIDKQKKIDAILDKISKSGYESLTKQEKDFLFSASNDK